MISIETVAREAVACAHCFTTLNLERPSEDDLAQPRWVGEGYRSSQSKIVVIQTNPGAGNGADQGIHRHRRELLKRFRDGHAGLAEVFEDQYADIPNWGMPQGKFKSYIENDLGLSFDEIALLNIAWCATKNDKYPKCMLSACFELHTSKLLTSLAPSAIILCGNEAQKFHPEISKLAQSARIFNVPHYAHRKGVEAGKESTKHVLQYVQQFKNSLGT